MGRSAHALNAAAGVRVLKSGPPVVLAHELSRPRRCWIWLRARPHLLFAAMFAMLLGFYASVSGVIAHDLLYIAIGLVSVAAISFGIRINKAYDALHWRLIGVGLLVTMMGEGGWAAYDLVGLEVPTFSWIDVLFLAAYPFFAVGVLLIARARTRGAGRAHLLDIASMTVALALFFGVLVVQPNIADGTLHFVDHIGASMYPMIDLMLAMVVMRLVITAGPFRKSPSLWLLAGGYAAQVTADSLYAVILARGKEFESGNPVDFVWLSGFALIAMAALHPSMRAITHPQEIRLGRLTKARIALLMLVTASAPIMMVVQNRVFGVDTLWPAAGAAIVLCALVVARMVGLLRSLEVHSGELATKIEQLALLQYERDQLLHRSVQGWEVRRSHIASELHDGPIQSLAALGYTVEQLGVLIDQQQYDAMALLVSDIGDRLRNEINSLRFVMTELRPPGLAEHGLVPAIEEYLEEFHRRTGVVVHSALHLGERLSESEEVTLFRLVQEALTNVSKHANASYARVTLEQRDGAVVMEIEDDGAGFDMKRSDRLLATRHFGLAIMRERAKFIGGDLYVASERHKGTTVTAVFPWGGSEA